MATVSAYPDALPTQTDVPATFAELPKHSTQHNVNNADTKAIATKLGTTQSFKGVERYADDAARDAELTTPVNGMVVYSGNVLQVRSGGVWKPVYQAWTTITTGFVAGSGWSLSNEVARVDNVNRTLSFVLYATRTGGTVTVASNGDHADLTLATLPAGAGGASGAIQAVSVASRTASAYFRPNTRLVVLTSGVPSVDIVNGNVFIVSGTCFLDE